MTFARSSYSTDKKFLIYYAGSDATQRIDITADQNGDGRVDMVGDDWVIKMTPAKARELANALKVAENFATGKTRA